MRKPTIALVVVLVFANFIKTADTAPQPAPQDITVYFSPKGGCTDAIVKELKAAKSTLAIQAYSFTSAPIVKASYEAYERGVKVVVVLDKSNDEKNHTYNGADVLFDHHVPTFIDSKHAIAHNKVMVIDGQTVIAGSFNFTKQAEDSNAENLLVMRRPDLAVKYADNIMEHYGHSQAYTGKKAN